MTSPNSGSEQGPYAIMTTSLGKFVIRLLPRAAPQTVANFISLANSGFYTNLVWHRIVPGFVIQTGDPTTKNGNGNRLQWGMGGGPKTVPLETDPSCHNKAGSVGLARGGDPNSGSSQFYVNLNDNSQSLDGGYAVFGEVVSGMSIVNLIAGSPIYTNGAYLDQPIAPGSALLMSVTIQDTP